MPLDIISEADMYVMDKTSVVINYNINDNKYCNETK